MSDAEKRSLEQAVDSLRNRIRPFFYIESCETAFYPTLKLVKMKTTADEVLAPAHKPPPGILRGVIEPPEDVIDDRLYEELTNRETVKVAFRIIL